jgi:gas vesicle protein
MNKFVTGLLAGVAIGILLAPDKGSETRKKLASKGEDLKDRFTDFVDEVSDKVDAAKEKISGMTRKGKETAREAVQRAQESYNSTLSQDPSVEPWTSNPLS